MTKSDIYEYSKKLTEEKEELIINDPESKRLIEINAVLDFINENLLD